MEVFEEGFLKDEYDKLIKFAPRGKPEELKYLMPINVHRATRWYKLLQEFKERDYAFDFRFSTDIEEFMWLLIFAYSLDVLVQFKKIDLKEGRIAGRLKDRQNFESFMYEVVVAANYASNGFDVEFPETFGGRVDIHAKKGGVEVHAECKRLRREEIYNELAIEIGSWLNEEKLNILLDVTFPRTPRKEDFKRVLSIVKDVVSSRSSVNKDIHVQVNPLPEYLYEPLPLQLPSPESIEFILSTSWVRFSEKGVEVKDPKVIIFRNMGKCDEVLNKLKNNLSKAWNKLKTVKNGRRVVYLDVSETVGKPVLQLPELVSLKSDPEVLIGTVETYIRSWLEDHAELDAIVLTEAKVYLDQLKLPYALALESRTMTSYTAPSWSTMMRVIPFPQNTPPELLVNLGLELKRRGYHNLAIHYFQKAIQEKPQLKEAYNNLGKLLTETGRSDEALTYLDKALEIDSAYVSALINKGIALANLWRFDEALKSLNDAIHLKPDDAKAWYNIALLYSMLRKFDEAYQYVNKALEIDSNYHHASKLKELLEKLKTVS